MKIEVPTKYAGVVLLAVAKMEAMDRGTFKRRRTRRVVPNTEDYVDCGACALWLALPRTKPEAGGQRAEGGKRGGR
jgi:hypothetical protein